jgi:hypothetical protein
VQREIGGAGAFHLSILSQMLFGRIGMESPALNWQIVIAMSECDFARQSISVRASIIATVRLGRCSFTKASSTTFANQKEDCEHENDPPFQGHHSLFAFAACSASNGE